MAIKILNLDKVEDDVQDVQQEINLLSKLSKSSSLNIVAYHCCFLVDTKLWIIMELCSGGSVRTLLKAGKLEEKYCAVIIREMLIALQYIHKEGIIHRDIKAANVLINTDGHVKLCDFGVAAQLSSSQYKRTSMIGTPYWMAPEVIKEGSGYNQKADIWSLGITLYEMITGAPPFSDQKPERALNLISRAKPTRLEGNQYSPALKEFVAMCLDEQPDERLSADELLKSKLVKNYKSYPYTILKEVITRYQLWRESHRNVRDSFLIPNPNAAGGTFTSLDGDDDDEDSGDSSSFDWDFDTTTDLPNDQNMAPSTPFGATTLRTNTNFTDTNTDILSPHEPTYRPTDMGGYFASHSISGSTAVPGASTSQTDSSYTSYSSTTERHPLLEMFDEVPPADSNNNMVPPGNINMGLPGSLSMQNTMSTFNTPIDISANSPFGNPIALHQQSGSSYFPGGNIQSPMLLKQQSASSASTPNLMNVASASSNMAFAKRIPSSTQNLQNGLITPKPLKQVIVPSNLSNSMPKNAPPSQSTDYQHNSANFNSMRPPSPVRSSNSGSLGSSTELNKADGKAINKNLVSNSLATSFSTTSLPSINTNASGETGSNQKTSTNGSDRSGINMKESSHIKHIAQRKVSAPSSLRTVIPNADSTQDSTKTSLNTPGSTPSSTPLMKSYQTSQLPSSSSNQYKGYSQNTNKGNSKTNNIQQYNQQLEMLQRQQMDSIVSNNAKKDFSTSSQSTTSGVSPPIASASASLPLTSSSKHGSSKLNIAQHAEDVSNNLLGKTQKLSLKQRQLSASGPYSGFQHQHGGSTRSNGVPFPPLKMVDCNILLDNVSKDVVIKEFGYQLNSFLQALNAIEDEMKGYVIN